MQINPFLPLYKEAFKWLGWLLLFVTLWFHGCSHPAAMTPQLVKVIVPEVKGKFKPQKPINNPIVMAKKRPENIQNSVIKQSLSTEKAMIEMAKENEKLKQNFIKATDSLKKQLYTNSIQLSNFSSKFEDDNLLLNINGVVQGEVKEITPNYTIKTKKTEVQVIPKETVFRLLGGLEIGNNTSLSNPVFKANLMLQNKKGNILTTSYDNNKNFYIGYNLSIFNIKR